MPGMEMLDAIIALWNAFQKGDDDRAYRIYFPICAIVALQRQAGLDGFLAVEKYLLVKRGIIASERRREPYSWELDQETAREIDRLFECLQTVVAQASALIQISEAGRIVVAPLGLAPDLARCLSSRLGEVARSSAFVAAAARAQRAVSYEEPSTLVARLQATAGERRALGPMLRGHFERALDDSGR